jgi:WAS family protein 1
MGTQVYAVPVVFHDLRPAEAYLQLFDALENLEKVSEEVFARVAGRVSEEKNRLIGLSGRLERASAGVAVLRSQYTSRATRVHSPAKLPLTSDHLYTPLYPLAREPPRRHPASAAALLASIPHPPSKPRDTVFHELVLDSHERATTSNAREQVEGLGRLPSHLSSVSSLLLFNTHENPYKKYVGLYDNLAGVAGPERPPSPHRQRQLHAPPKTVAEGDVLPAHELEQYTYQPPMGDVPQFTSLPNALPLEMLANDEQWSNATALQSFAPSLPMLPSVGPGRFTLSQNLTSPSNATAVVPPTQALVVAQEAIPLPPPETIHVSVPDIAALELPSVTETSSTLQDNAAADEDGSFLAQIRQGKKLKPAEKKEEEKKPAAAPAGDLFGDLILALQRRRNNLGGKSDSKAAARKEGSEEIALPAAETKEEEEKWDD